MFTLEEIASKVDGKIIGDPLTRISGVAALEDAKEGELSFVLDENKALAADNSRAAAFITSKNFKHPKKPVIQVDSPRLALAKILGDFSPVEEITPGVDQRSHIGKNVALGKRVLIYPFVYVGDNCIIGEDTIIHPNVTIYPRTVIGKRCIVHAGSVIGIDGFGFVQEQGKYVKIPQIGRVVIEDDVEVYANNSVARGTIGDTVIKRGTKIDNMNHIAHNVKIGCDCGITAMSAFGGSASIGDRVQMSGQCGIAPHASVGNDSILMGRAAVTKDMPPKSILLGYPAQDHMKEHKLLALVRKLPELFERIKKLEAKKK